VAAELVCDRVGDGSMLLLDRSAVAGRRALRRCALQVEAGRLTVVEAALTDASLPAGHFDKAFCVDVNVFWTGDPAPELRLLRGALRPGGRLWVLYGRGPAQAEAVLEAVEGAMRREGFEDVEVLRAPDGFGVLGVRPEGS
jgi:SAM-dependent methyltransferase